MFDEMFSGEGDSSAIDVLKTLLDKENVEMKTDLNMSQIKVLTQLKWFALLRENPDQDPMIILTQVLEYYLMLMVSLKRKSREEIIKGVSEMKEQFLEQQLMLQNLMTQKK